MEWRCERYEPALAIPMGLTNWLKKPAARSHHWNTAIPLARAWKEKSWTRNAESSTLSAWIRADIQEHTAGQRDVLELDGYTLSVDRGEVHVLKERNEIGLGGNCPNESRR